MEQVSLPGLFAAAGVGLVIPAVIAYRYRSIWDFVATDHAPSDAEALVVATS